MKETTEKREQLPSHEENDVLFPNVSARGGIRARVLVYP